MPGSFELKGEKAEFAKRKLRIVTDILEENGIEYILDYGTLLGIVRENRLLPWDTDIDISIRKEFLEKFLKIRGKLWRAGFRTRLRKFKKDMAGFKKGDIRLIKIQTKRFLIFRQYRLMDLFIKERREDGYYYVVGSDSPVLKKVPLEYHDNLTKILFDGKKYSVPKNYKEYLTYVYGDWKTPIKEWDFRTDDNCVVELL